MKILKSSLLIMTVAVCFSSCGLFRGGGGGGGHCPAYGTQLNEDTTPLNTPADLHEIVKSKSTRV